MRVIRECADSCQEVAGKVTGSGRSPKSYGKPAGKRLDAHEPRLIKDDDARAST